MDISEREYYYLTFNDGFMMGYIMAHLDVVAHILNDPDRDETKNIIEMLDESANMPEDLKNSLTIG